MGRLRTPKDTRDTAASQIQKAMVSARQVKVSLSDTGVQDASTASIRAALSELGRQLRKKEKKSEVEVQRQLNEELDRLLGVDSKVEDRINPLLGMKSKGFASALT